MKYILHGAKRLVSFDIRPVAWFDMQMDICDMHPIANDSFDCFVAMSVLHHVRDDEKAIDEIYRVLRPGGRFLAHASKVVNGRTYRFPDITKHYGDDDLKNYGVGTYRVYGHTDLIMLVGRKFVVKTFHALIRSSAGRTSSSAVSSEPKAVVLLIANRLENKLIEDKIDLTINGEPPERMPDALQVEVADSRRSTPATSAFLHIYRSPMKTLIITIDLEAVPKGQSADHVNRLIWGRFGTQEVGIRRMMDIADQYGHKLAFFVDYCEAFLYLATFEAISAYIVARGHDQQLHAHPVPDILPDAFWTSRSFRPSKNALNEYTIETGDLLMRFLVQCAPWGATLRSRMVGAPFDLTEPSSQ